MGPVDRDLVRQKIRFTKLGPTPPSFVGFLDSVNNPMLGWALDSNNQNQTMSVSFMRMDGGKWITVGDDSGQSGTTRFEPGRLHW